MLKFFFVILLILISPLSLATVRSFGHLLSRNDYIADEYRCVIGIEFVGCRFNSTLIGTSPFLFDGYKLKSLLIRQKIFEDNQFVHTLDLGLVNNIHKIDPNNLDELYDFERQCYDMSAIMVDYIITFKLLDNKKLSFNNSVFYYSNYRKPFSLRRPDPGIKKVQLNSSLLLESPFTEQISTATELGFLQYNGKYPRIQAGASLDFHGAHLLIKIGFSVTSTLQGFFVTTDRSARSDYQQELLSTQDGFYQVLDIDKVKHDFAVHPEINLQYFF